MYTMEYYSAIKNHEIIPFPAARMDLESVALSEVSQTEKEKHHMTSLLCGVFKEMMQMNLQNRKRLRDLENKLIVPRGRDSSGLWEGHVHSAVFEMDNQQGPIV